MCCLAVGLCRRCIMAKGRRKRARHSSRRSNKTGMEKRRSFSGMDGHRTSSNEERLPSSGRGRPRKPMRILDANLKYAQVVKHRERGHLIEREKRVIWGTEEELGEIIH